MMGKMSKTHYATVERGNESNPYDEWSTTLCGLEYTESPTDNDIKWVTCKHCLRMYPKYKESMNKALENEFSLYKKVYPNNILHVKYTPNNFQILSRELGEPVWFCKDTFGHLKINIDDGTWMGSFDYEWLYVNQPPLINIEDLL